MIKMTASRLWYTINVFSNECMSFAIKFNFVQVNSVLDRNILLIYKSSIHSSMFGKWKKNWSKSFIIQSAYVGHIFRK